MFSAAISFNAVISKWDVPDVFGGDIGLTLSSRSGTCQMFSVATSFDAVISKWDVSDVFGGDIV